MTKVEPISKECQTAARTFCAMRRPLSDALQHFKSSLGAERHYLACSGVWSLYADHPRWSAISAVTLLLKRD